MSKVRRIEWTFHTAAAEGSGTDSRVTIRIFRDAQQLAYVNQEPGETARLDRGETGTYSWTFENPSNLGTAVSGQAVPYTENFPSGVRGHLNVQLEIWGDDAWRIGTIDSRVVAGHMESIPGTIDSWTWVEDPEDFVFGGEDVLSSDAAEGYRRLNLNY